MQVGNILRAAVQVSRAAVVAQTAPQTQHLIQRRGSQIDHRRETFQKAGVVVQYRDHLRLLQHDFGQPHTVGIPRVLPGQTVTAVAFLPAHDVSGKPRGR